MDSRKVCRALGLPVIPTDSWRSIGSFGEIRRTRTVFKGVSCYVVIQHWYNSLDDFWLVGNDLDLPCFIMQRDLFNVGYGQNVDYKTKSYRIDNVKTTDEIIQRFDANAAYQKILMAVFS
jgi:hypothetical protein